MRIKQLYSSFGIGFKEAAMKKFGLVDYNHPTEPLLAVGLYNSQQWAIVNVHQEEVVIYWCGSDLTVLRNINDKWKKEKGDDCFWVKSFRNSKKFHHVVSSHWLADDLAYLDIPYHFLPVSLVDHSDIKPEPLGDCIYMYKPQSKIYNGGLYEEVKRRVPFEFIEAFDGANTFTREQLLDVYRRCFLGLRFTSHDGMSETAVEMGLMGRLVIHNGDLPNCVNYTDDVDEIVESIKVIREHCTFYEATASYVREYLHDSDDWLYTEYYG